MERKADLSSLLRDKIFLGMSFKDYVRSNLTIPNAAAAAILKSKGMEPAG